jgi:hypothetical protein
VRFFVLLEIRVMHYYSLFRAVDEGSVHRVSNLFAVCEGNWTRESAHVFQDAVRRGIESIDFECY